MYDYHIHSNFSADCQDNMESIVKRAIEIGVKEVCFTDHWKYDLTFEGVREEVFDLIEYYNEIHRLKEIYGHRLTIKKGVEIGIQPHIIKKCNDFIANNDFDFVICSIHTADKLDIHHGDFFSGRTAKQAFAKYFEEFYDCVKNGFQYNVLGHYDLLKRHIQYDGNKILKENFDIIEATLKHVIETGKGIEVNTSGFRYQLGHTLPSKDILKLYKELGGEIITTGSDSHGPEYLADQFNYTHNLLKELDFQYITIFEKMKPQFIKI